MSLSRSFAIPLRSPESRVPCMSMSALFAVGVSQRRLLTESLRQFPYILPVCGANSVSSAAITLPSLWIQLSHVARDAETVSSTGWLPSAPYRPVFAGEISEASRNRSQLKPMMVHAITLMSHQMTGDTSPVPAISRQHPQQKPTLRSHRFQSILRRAVLASGRKTRSHPQRSVVGDRPGMVPSPVDPTGKLKGPLEFGSRWSPNAQERPLHCSLLRSCRPKNCVLRE